VSTQTKYAYVDLKLGIQIHKIEFFQRDRGENYIS